MPDRGKGRAEILRAGTFKRCFLEFLFRSLTSLQQGAPHMCIVVKSSYFYGQGLVNSTAKFKESGRKNGHLATLVPTPYTSPAPPNHHAPPHHHPAPSRPPSPSPSLGLGKVRHEPFMTGTRQYPAHTHTHPHTHTDLFSLFMPLPSAQIAMSLQYFNSNIRKISASTDADADADADLKNHADIRGCGCGFGYPVHL